ncbi:KxYKxGKxW signal peptide domain-containing protein [Weissella halotolerans]|nr:KxYKxGKxW signal peptide domain-containing protein [Weissella halotolerans]
MTKHDNLVSNRRYKMYKDGKHWVFAGLTTVALTLGGISVTTVSADVTQNDKVTESTQSTEVPEKTNQVTLATDSTNTTDPTTPDTVTGTTRTDPTNSDVDSNTDLNTETSTTDTTTTNIVSADTTVDNAETTTDSTNTTDPTTPDTVTNPTRTDPTSSDVNPHTDLNTEASATDTTTATNTVSADTTVDKAETTTDSTNTSTATKKMSTSTTDAQMQLATVDDTVSSDGVPDSPNYIDGFGVTNNYSRYKGPMTWRPASEDEYLFDGVVQWDSAKNTGSSIQVAFTVNVKTDTVTAYEIAADGKTILRTYVLPGTTSAPLMSQSFAGYGYARSGQSIQLYLVKGTGLLFEQYLLADGTKFSDQDHDGVDDYTPMGRV